MASLNSCINPIALYMVSKLFKTCFKECLCCWCITPEVLTLEEVQSILKSKIQEQAPEQH
ncbi:unnamed protein product [Coregonus sp. 'balchen']|nr:unnamed protein product [Coregonus sp. 'balchen']